MASNSKHLNVRRMTYRKPVNFACIFRTALYMSICFACISIEVPTTGRYYKVNKHSLKLSLQYVMRAPISAIHLDRQPTTCDVLGLRQVPYSYFTVLAIDTNDKPTQNSKGIIEIGVDFQEGF